MKFQSQLPLPRSLLQPRQTQIPLRQKAKEKLRPKVPFMTQAYTTRLSHPAGQDKPTLKKRNVVESEDDHESG